TATARRSTLFPYTTLFRSRPFGRGLGEAARTRDDNRAAARRRLRHLDGAAEDRAQSVHRGPRAARGARGRPALGGATRRRLLARSEEHTSELQSRENLVCR